MSLEIKLDNRERILASVTMKGVLQMFCPGTKLDRQDRCACPIHGGTKNSFKIYDNTNSFYCFACGSAGDPIKFVSLLFNVSYGQAIKEIASAFNIPLGTITTREDEIRFNKARRVANIIIELDKKEEKMLSPLIEKNGELITEIITIQGILHDRTFEKYAYEEYAQLRSLLDYHLYCLECVEDEISTIKARNERIKRGIRNEGISNCQKVKKGRKYAKPHNKTVRANNL